MNRPKRYSRNEWRCGRGELNLGLEKGCARDQQDVNSLSLSMGEGVFTDCGLNNVPDSEWAADGVFASLNGGPNDTSNGRAIWVITA